jgi:hypothetical protein
MKGNTDCPSLQGWLTLRVYSINSSEQTNQSIEMEEMKEFTRCYIVVDVSSFIIFFLSYCSGCYSGGLS